MTGGGWSGGWGGAKPELAVAAGLVLALAAAAWALDGPSAASLVVLVSVAISLVLLRGLVSVTGHADDQATDSDGQQARAGPLGLEQIRLTHSFTGFWRTQSDLASASKSLSAWDFGTRPRLTNLLAARLAERHGVSLADDPQAARRLLLGDSGDSGGDLWYWIDPQRASPPDASRRPGIPPRTLAALIKRLEQL